MRGGHLSVFERDFVTVVDRFPKLRIDNSEKSKFWKITGELDICDVEGDYWGAFQIRIYVPKSYPYCIPIVQELSDIVPRNIDWHISKEGFCCLDIPHRLQSLAKKGIVMADFIAQKVYPFFANQLFRLREKVYAGSEYLHYFRGVKQFYEEDLRLSPEQALTVLEAFSLSKLPGRNQPCLCGSRIKLKRCHLREIEFLKSIELSQIKQDLIAFKDMFDK